MPPQRFSDGTLRYSQSDPPFRGTFCPSRSCICEGCQFYFDYYIGTKERMPTPKHTQTGESMLKLEIRLPADVVEWLMNQGKRSMTPASLVEEIVQKAYQNEKSGEKFSQTIPGDTTPTVAQPTTQGMGEELRKAQEQVQREAAWRTRVDQAADWVSGTSSDTPIRDNPMCGCGMRYMDQVQDCRHHYPNPPYNDVRNLQPIKPTHKSLATDIYDVPYI